MDPALLRKYKPLSSETYGEANMVLVLKMLQQCSSDFAGKAFIDLGSGVGQVCMMVAALSNASNCFGIELMRHPAEYADKMLSRFALQMQANGWVHAPIRLKQGNFLHCSEVNSQLRNAGVVFINNPRFDASLNRQILTKLCCLLPKGATLICFESLIGTKNYWDDCMKYKTAFICDKDCVSWHGHEETLHVLEKL